jgi:hypothetical protein
MKKKNRIQPGISFGKLILLVLWTAPGLGVNFFIQTPTNHCHTNEYLVLNNISYLTIFSNFIYPGRGPKGCARWF